MTNKKIAFISHKTRGQEIIKILEGMGGVNKYNLDGSKGIIAIETNRGNYITNDWDCCGLIMNGWKIYTLEEYEKLEKTAQDFAVDILTKERECYFDDLDVDIVAEAYIAGYDECNQNGCLETKPKMVSIDKVKEWLKYNFGNSFVIDCYGCLTNETEVTTSFDTMEQLLDDFEKTMENEYN